ncbi:hypothetical protein CCACVL1_24032 [Corchorus capsularis]|uniref:Uncharacterized protein n=1 Tax=Corchorus capsularis TaxID=210143 RepID=A0A1R3GRH2_COCAP|nr:hypothetical protein CCACVL1_24032 [Corchorus capsularis]
MALAKAKAFLTQTKFSPTFARRATACLTKTLALVEAFCNA